MDKVKIYLALGVTHPKQTERKQTKTDTFDDYDLSLVKLSPEGLLTVIYRQGTQGGSITIPGECPEVEPHNVGFSVHYTLTERYVEVDALDIYSLLGAGYSVKREKDGTLMLYKED